MDEALSDVVHEGHVGLSVKPGLEGRADFVGLLRAVCEQVDDREGQGLRDAGEGGLAVAKLVVGAVENAVDAADPGVDDGHEERDVAHVGRARAVFAERDLLLAEEFDGVVTQDFAEGVVGGEREVARQVPDLALRADGVAAAPEGAVDGLL